jgi:hypothetical protein
MKKLLSTLGLILIAITVSESQIIKGFGIDVGYVYAKENFEYAPYTAGTGDGIRPISTFSGGVFAETFDMMKFSIVGKLQYVGKGGVMSVQTNIVDPSSPQAYLEMKFEDKKFRLDYLCVPVLLKYRVALPKIEPYLAIGPRFEYMVGHPSPFYDGFKNTEWTMTYSAGADISLPSLPKLFIEAEYNTSLTDAFQDSWLTVSDHSIEFLVGVYF